MDSYVLDPERVTNHHPSRLGKLPYFLCVFVFVVVVVVRSEVTGNGFGAVVGGGGVAAKCVFSAVLILS